MFAHFAHRLESGADIAVAYADAVLEEQALLSLRRSLIDFNLSWTAIGAVLQGRDKVIIDAEQPGGKMHLFLFDPDLLRPGLVFPSIQK